MVLTSTVSFGDFLNFFLLLESVWTLDVSFLGIDDLVSQAFSDCLLGLYWSVSGSVSDQVDCQVYSSHWWDINCLLSNNTTSSDTGGVFSWACQQQSSDQDFDRVSTGEEVNDFECMSDDSDGLDFLSSVSSWELHWANKSFDNGAECFSESFGLISSSGVGDKNLRLGGLDSDIVDEAWVINLDKDRVTVISSYDHLLKSFGVFSNPLLALSSTI